MNHNLFDQTLIRQLSDNEKNLLEQMFRLPAPHQMGIQELADSTYSSPASIIRLCKKLGLDGFNDFKYLLRQESRQPPVPNASQELKSVIEHHYRELTDTAKQITEADLRFAADCLCSDKNIYLFARGMSYMPVTYMHQVLLSIDRDCLCYIDPPLMFHAASNMTADDVVFIASSGGATDGIQKAAQLVKEHQATVIALTSDCDSPLSQLADVTFYCAAPKRYLNDIDLKSRFTIMFVIDVILDCYLSRLNLNPPSDPQIYINQKNW